jgi:gas vesicle protein
VWHIFFYLYYKTLYMKGTITTLLVGIVIGMLIAPEKGSVTRRKIADLIDDLTEAGEHLASKPDSSRMPGDLS